MSRITLPVCLQGQAADGVQVQCCFTSTDAAGVVVMKMMMMMMMMM